MTALTKKTIVYEWAGPPIIRLYRTPVTRGDHSWEQHILGSNEAGIGVVALTVYQDKLLLVSQFRPAIGETLLEFPRGFGNIPEDGMTPEQQATLDGERETLEETGMAARSSAFLGYIWPDGGIIGTKIAVVTIEADTDEPVAENDTEVDSVIWMDHEEVLDRICTREITDSITLSAYSLWSAMMNKTFKLRLESESLSSYLNRTKA